jgi:arylsulfatase A-like enzyme
LLDESIPDACQPARDAGWDQWEDSLRHSDQPVRMPEDYYGYQDVDLVVGHGDRPSGHYVHWAKERGFDPEQDAGPDRALDDHGGHWGQVYTSAVPAELHPSAYVAERTCTRLEEFADSGEPFFLFASFPDPHHPFAPPAGYDQLYDPAQIPVPTTFHQDHSASPEHVRRMAERRGIPSEDPTMTWIATEEQYRAACAAELGLITLLDDQVGRILQTLERTALTENTIVVFTSDHGDMFGDHGMMLKHFTHYRGVTNVPLVIRVPAVLSGADTDVSPEALTAASTALVSNADLVPTLLELAGVPGHRGIQGRSLLPLLQGETPVHRHAVIVEEDQPFGLDGLPAPVHIRSVITPEARYTRYFGTETEELYLLVSDPDEEHNVAAEPECAQVLERMRQLMLDELLALTDHGYRVLAGA